MSHCQRILHALQDGQWKTTHTLYMECGPMILHSRISDLRKKGHNVQGRHVPGQTGADGYEYRLATEAHMAPPQVRRPEPPHSPEAAPAAEQLRLLPVPAAHYDN